MKNVIYKSLIIIIFFKGQLLLGFYYHGFGMQLTTEGQGVYYKPILMSDKNNQLTCDVGLFKGVSQLQTNTSKFKSNTNKVDIALGYNYSIYKNMIAGTFRPIGILKVGGLSNISSISIKNMIGKWMIKYMFGIGVQFYNGNNLNELSIKYYSSKASSGSIAFMITYYWI